MVEIGDGLRLHPLSGIHQQKGALASGDRTGHLVGEVHVTRRVNKVENVLLALVVVLHLDGVALDGNAALAFQVHVVEHLILEIAVAHGLGILQQTVGQRALAVINMRNNTEISNIFHKAAKIRKISVSRIQAGITRFAEMLSHVSLM